MFKIKPFIIFCFGRLLATLFITEAATASSYEFWIGTNTTGNLFTNVLQYSGGTSNEPFDGSNETNFDFCMSNFPPNTTIHLLPGTFQTLGGIPSGNGWNILPGDRLLGSGMYATVLQHPKWQLTNHAILDHYNIISAQGWWFNPDGNVDIEDLTCDGNFYPSNHLATDHTLMSGIELGGSSNIVKRVRLINLAAYGTNYNDYQENWGIVINPSYIGPSISNVIESCKIRDFTCNFYCDMTAISFAGGMARSNIIVQISSNTIYGFLVSGPATVSYNTTYGVTLFSHSDNPTVNMTDVSVQHNIIINCAAALDWYNGTVLNCNFNYNTVVGAASPNNAYHMLGFFPNNSDGITNFYGLMVVGNYFKSSQPASAASYLLNLQGGQWIMLVDNIIDPAFTVRFFNCTNIVMVSNFDLSGKLFTKMNNVTGN